MPVSSKPLAVKVSRSSLHIFGVTGTMANGVPIENNAASAAPNSTYLYARTPLFAVLDPPAARRLAVTSIGRLWWG